jgi:hypothetical protein
MTTGLVAIKGNHMDKLSEIFSFFRLVDSKEDSIYSNWEEVCKFFETAVSDPDKEQLIAVSFQNGWTIIEDSDLSLSYETESLEKISLFVDSHVFSFFIQTTSSNHAFYYFNKGLGRSYHYDDGAIHVNFGEPLKEEAGLDLTDFDSMFKLSSNLGVDWDKFLVYEHFLVKKLTYNEELQAEIDQCKKMEKKKIIVKKAWWKFW